MTWARWDESERRTGKRRTAERRTAEDKRIGHRRQPGHNNRRVGIDPADIVVGKYRRRGERRPMHIFENGQVSTEHFHDRRSFPERRKADQYAYPDFGDRR